MYLAIYIILFTISFFEIRNNIKFKTTLKVLMIFLTFFCGFRYKNGVDYESYLSIFTNLNNFESFYFLEKGFRIIIIIIKNYISKVEPEDFFLIFSMINFYFLYKVLKKVRFPIFSLAIYYCLFFLPYNFNAIRQSINLSIYLLFLECMLKKIYKKSLVYFVLALLLHNSALIYFPITYLIKYNKTKINKKKIIIILLLFIASLFISKYLFLILGIFVEKINFFNKYYDNSIGVFGLIQRIIYFSIFSFLVLKSNSKKIEYIYKIYSIGFILYAIFSKSAMFSTRINMGFRIIEVVMLPVFLSSLKNYFDKIRFYIIISLLLLLPLLKDINLDEYSPYKFNRNMLVRIIKKGVF